MNRVSGRSTGEEKPWSARRSLGSGEKVKVYRPTGERMEVKDLPLASCGLSLQLAEMEQGSAYWR